MKKNYRPVCGTRPYAREFAFEKLPKLYNPYNNLIEVAARIKYAKDLLDNNLSNYISLFINKIGKIFNVKKNETLHSAVSNYYHL